MLAGACADNTTQHGAVIAPERWPLVFQGAATTYSVSYVPMTGSDSSEPVRAVTRITGIQGAAPTCELHPTDDVWWFSIDLTDTEPGTYTVVQYIFDSPERRLASVQLEFRQGEQTVSRRRAVGGSVNVTQLTATLEARRSGQPLLGSAQLEFGIPNAESRGCTSLVAPPRPDMPILACECVTASGMTFACIHEGQEGDCCVDHGDERKTVSFELDAEPCSP